MTVLCAVDVPFTAQAQQFSASVEARKARFDELKQGHSQNIGSDFTFSPRPDFPSDKTKHQHSFNLTSSNTHPNNITYLSLTSSDKMPQAVAEL